ncbi:MAG: hypothetical protein PHT44_03455 [Candidatus Portnoybacteria bacterium]|nr:hypothetical protein [Candidatus Portnoybacteria bacterium]MDD4983116.1 hypothetical protein [Candidatus Portnoybacteria bacterium]
MKNLSGFNVKVISWKGNVPRIDRVPFDVKDENEGRKGIVSMARTEADTSGMETCIVLYQGDRFIDSTRAVPASAQ